MELQSELQQALDVMINECENVEMPFQLNVKSIVAYVKVGEYRILRSTLISQLIGNPNLSRDLLTWIKTCIWYVKPKLLTTTNHDTMLNLGCDCGVCFLSTLETSISINVVDQRN